MKKISILIISILITFSQLLGQRVKDISYFKGIETEQLIGYGLAVGLSGTGDSYRSLMTEQSVRSMLKRFGVTITDKNLRTRNVAAVMVTARLNNLYKKGASFDVIVSSIGDATSLMGATLLMTPLSGPNGKVYGIAQGPISIGGFDFNTGSGGRVARNVSLAGRIPNGGSLESDLPGGILSSKSLSIMLNSPDFTTANNIVKAVDSLFGKGTAKSLGASEIKITVPQNQQNDFGNFIAQLESVQVLPDVEARVVINERTGTVVAGSNVRIAPVTISHGGLNITIRSMPIISQPNAFSQGQTQVFNNLIPQVKEEGKNAVAINGASNVQQVAAALNQLKVTPRDIIAIFQALKQAGALTAKLVII